VRAAWSARATGAAGARSTGVEAPPRGATLRRLVRSDRGLQVILAVALAANLGSGGMSEVALPALARGPLHTGAGGYGGLLAALSGGALVGTLAGGQADKFRRPAVAASFAFVADAICFAIVPYLGSALPAGAALALAGGFMGFGNLLGVTLIQRLAPPELLGRLMGLVMLCSLGTFPLSVAVGGVAVREFGPAPFFPATAAVVVVAVVAGLTQRAWRDFGATEPALRAGMAPAATSAPFPTPTTSSGEPGEA
ncbi:MAG: hypothetical protein ACRDZX_10150, partial [Acidimicrobiales bacterium]